MIQCLNPLSSASSPARKAGAVDVEGSAVGCFSVAASQSRHNFLPPETGNPHCVQVPMPAAGAPAVTGFVDSALTSTRVELSNFSAAPEAPSSNALGAGAAGSPGPNSSASIPT